MYIKIKGQTIVFIVQGNKVIAVPTIPWVKLDFEDNKITQGAVLTWD